MLGVEGSLSVGTHTPGPWEWKPSGEEANHFMVVKPKGGFNGDAIIAHLRCEENARLIAAAPDLLHALKETALALARARTINGDLVEQRLAADKLAAHAIAKAEGA